MLFLANFPSVFPYRKEVFAISVDRKNSALLHTLTALDPPPLHVSADIGYGRVETATLFPELELSLEEPAAENPEEVIEKFLARTAHRVASLSEFVEKEAPKAGKRRQPRDEIGRAHV